MTRSGSSISMVTLAAGLAACGGGTNGTSDTGVTASDVWSTGLGSSGGIVGSGGTGTDAGAVGADSLDGRDGAGGSGAGGGFDVSRGGGGSSGGTGTDAGLIGTDARDANNGAGGIGTGGALDASTGAGGSDADTGVDAPAVVNALSAGRTYAYHELTSLPAESQNWPVISGNGRVIAFATGTSSPTQIAVNVVNADGSGQQEIDRYTPLCFCGGTVDISADGQHVVSTESVQIRHARVGGTANAVLTLDSNELWDIRISADGTRIFFLLRRDAGISGTSTKLERGVYVVNVDGSEPKYGMPLVSIGP